MKLNIHARKVQLSESARKYIEQRASFAFSRTRHVINSLSVTVTDINGPRGGKDKQCKIMIRADALPDIVVTEKQSSLGASINRALSRASQNLQQRLKRKHTSQGSRSLAYRSDKEQIMWDESTPTALANH